MIQSIEKNMDTFVQTFKDTMNIINQSENLILTDEYLDNQA